MSEVCSRPLYSVDWSDGGVAVGTGNDRICVYRNTGADATGWFMAASVDCAHGGDVNSVRWSPSGEYLCSGGDDGEVKVWQFTADM